MDKLSEAQTESSGDVASPCSIAVCCGTPLIWTFMFSGSEWYCRKCKRDFPMFNAHKIDGTPELTAEKNENEQWFRAIAKDCIPRGAKKRDCEKCEGGEYHLDHATEEERAASRRAYAMLTSQ